ncbi:hypothetical protein U9M48_003569 [Paspalum notatum var. saurae]|uniref:Uncharacterized protein n=1 Tax=Paspalum notatum var. saurae TaxID=547442 RepID=A0AAQ3PSZ8_PASNO
MLAPLFPFSRRCLLLVVRNVPPSANNGILVLRCLLLFDVTNYRAWVPSMRWHMRGLHLWEFLTGELPYPPLPQARVGPEVPKKILASFDDLMVSYESQFSAHRLWLDEDARSGSILTTTIED